MTRLDVNPLVISLVQVGRFVETFLVESWREHLCQHHRATNADRILQNAVRNFDAPGEPTLTHFVSAAPRG